jgi:3-polyprenyl-4-hydroxybenzoate decarboxylase
MVVCGGRCSTKAPQAEGIADEAISKQAVMFLRETRDLLLRSNKFT